MEVSFPIASCGYLTKLLRKLINGPYRQRIMDLLRVDKNDMVNGIRNHKNNKWNDNKEPFCVLFYLFKSFLAAKLVKVSKYPFYIDHLFCIVFTSTGVNTLILTERYNKFINFLLIIYRFQFEMIKSQEFVTNINLSCSSCSCSYCGSGEWRWLLVFNNFRRGGWVSTFQTAAAATTTSTATAAWSRTK